MWYYVVDSFLQLAGFESVHLKYLLLTYVYVVIKNVHIQRIQSEIGCESRDLILIYSLNKPSKLK